VISHHWRHFALQLIFGGAWLLWGYPWGNLANAFLVCWLMVSLGDFMQRKIDK